MTGPNINGMPAFHLLLASGVLATGMEASKVLRVFINRRLPAVYRRLFGLRPPAIFLCLVNFSEPRIKLLIKNNLSIVSLSSI
jgi:hypothetical protein